MRIFKQTIDLQNIIYFFITITLIGLASCSDDDNIFIIPSDPDKYIYEIHFVDVGQGDAILVTTPEKTLLVDGGRRDTGITDYLDALEIEEIDIVIGTHPHADHIGGLIDVFYNFEVGEIIDPGTVHTTNTYNEYLELIDFYNIPYTEGRKGMERDLGENAFMEIIYPPEPIPTHQSSRLNNASIVARVTLGEITLLLTGDAEKEAESDMLDDPGLLASDILKVGHHGSKTSSTANFLEAVQPEVSVIMCGEDNQYGHPHSEALARLNAVETEIYVTATHGHIVIKSDGENYTISTEK